VGSISSTPNGGVLNNILAPLFVYAQPNDTLNLDDTGFVGSQTGTLTRNYIYGLGMAATGIFYNLVGHLNIELGESADQFSVQSSALGTTIRLVTLATSNTWYVGSNAPIDTGGFLSGIRGPVIILGGGANAALTDRLHFDDSGSTATSETGQLTDSTLTGLGMRPTTRSSPTGPITSMGRSTSSSSATSSLT
jgi:hypothetical protein